VALRFDLIPVEKQKDIMVNVARCTVIRNIAVLWNWLQCYSDKPTKSDNVWKLPIWCMLPNIQFQIYHGQCYWLAYDRARGGTLLTQTGPTEWTTTPPDYYEYICRVKWLGDYTWIEVDLNGESVLK
jgi:hypothetical protein